MTEKKKNSSEKEAEVFTTLSEAEADYGLSMWFGAIFYYLIHLGKYPFSHFHAKKYERRNVWTGWFLKIIIVGLSLYLFWIFGDVALY